MHLWRTMKQPSWQQITDQRTKKRQRPGHMYARKRTQPQGQKLGTSVVPWRPWRARHCRSVIIQASTWAILCKHDWKWMARRRLGNDHAQINRYTSTGKPHLHEEPVLKPRTTRSGRSTMGTNGRTGQSSNK